MTPQLFAKLNAQIGRQTIELADYVDRIKAQAALDAAQARPDDAPEDWQPPDATAQQDALQAAQANLAAAQADLAVPTGAQAPLKAAADALEAAIAQCRARLEGVDMPAEALDAYAASVAAAQARAAAKARRAEAVGSIVVTTQAGHAFDGDETSQGRMARAIIALQATGTPAVRWVLADNTVIDAPLAELVEALALSGAAQAALWVL